MNRPSQPTGVILPAFADYTFPCFGSWSIDSEECARCNRCGTCMAHLFDKGELAQEARTEEAFA